MKIKVFGKQGCAKCETTKNKFGHFLKKNETASSAVLEFYDMDTIDGMTEGAYHNVSNIPTSLIERNGELLARWEGTVPNTEDFKVHFEQV